MSRKIRLPAYRPEVMRLLDSVVCDSGYAHEYCRRIARNAGHEYDPKGFVIMLQKELHSLIRENQFPEHLGKHLEAYFPQIVDVLVKDPDLAGRAKSYLDEYWEDAI